MKQNYKPELEKFSADLENLVRQRAEIDKKIHRLKQIIQNVAAMSGVEADEALAPLVEYDNRGLTSGIRTILKVLNSAMTAADVRQSLIASGYDLSNYANASSVINTVLNRFAEKGLVIKGSKVKDDQTFTTYKWVRQK